MVINLFWSEYHKQISENKTKIAIKHGAQSITYQQLDQQSDLVATFIAANYSRNNYICIDSTKSIETIISMVGILKTGKAFIPVDPALPEKRKDYIIQQQGCAFYKYNVQKPTGLVEKFNLPYISPTCSAYVIYTSGSTGYPKGVEITYHNMLTTFAAVNQTFNHDQTLIGLNVAPFNFDLSIYDIFNTLMIGGTLILAPDSRNVPEILALLKEQEVNFWNSVPMVMEMLVQIILFKYPQQRFPKMKTIFLSGDKTTVKLAHSITQIFPNARLVSLGGATECAIWSNYFEFQREPFPEKILPYGYPLAGQELLILDDQLHPCELEQVGEIYIAGGGVAKGYFNNEQKNVESFIPTTTYGKIYKTGDAGVKTAAGYINFLGRQDRQVKIRGYRVELDEIENVLNRHLNARCAVALTNDRIALKITKQAETSLEKIKQICQQELPVYMHPTSIEFVEGLLLTKNGKIDYKQMFQKDG